MEAVDGLALRELTRPEEMAEVVAVQAEIWAQTEATPANQLLISVKSGGHVLAAFDGDRLAGFAYGFPAVLAGQEPWIASHMLAVRPEYRSRGLGRRLKWWQRDWALAHGFRRITWTADPLEARNAHLNLNRLGAVGRRYLENCYGEMNDALNAGLPSDRLWLEWPLDHPRVERARRGELAPPADGDRVPVPPDFQAVRRRDREQALRWRLAVRRALSGKLGDGTAVVGFDPAACALVVASDPMGEART
jgi:predicted GNAT superfamily acetyltransferase